MKNSHVWMIIGCALPLVLIFFLPVFGVGSSELLFVFLILCFGAHLLMMRGHRHEENDKDDSQKGEGHHGSH